MRPPEQSARHRAIAALLLGVLSVLSLLGTGHDYHRAIYLVVFAVLVGIIAAWFGVTALRSARRSDTMRPRWAIFGTVLGGLGAVLGALLLVFIAAYWQQLNTYSQCLNSANTQSAVQACANQLQRSVKIGRLGTGG
jgi:predicted PurR-regulated permease PerM